MQTIQIAGVNRANYGKKAAKDVRREKMIPCVIYGGKGEPVSFSVEEKAIKPLLFTPNAYIVEFDIEGVKEVGVLRDVQYHPVKDHALHMDFFRVIEGQPVVIDIPVKLTGVSEGVKAGGKLGVQKRKLRVSGMIEFLPDTLNIDITDLTIGKAIFVGDLKYDNLKLLSQPSTSVCAVFSTRATISAAAAAAKK